MHITSPQGFYQSSLLASLPGIRHAFSTRPQGDGRDDDVKQRLVGGMGGRASRIISARQVHGNVVSVVGPDMTGVVEGSDGLAMAYTAHPSVLTVRTADCVPLLLADPKARVVAAVHSGWKGTAGDIAGQAVAAMSRLGSSPADIRACIGPHIGACCYDIPPDRVEQFTARYGDDPLVVSMSGGKWYADIGRGNYINLYRAGVLPEHIDVPVACTSCQVDTFFSYRKDTKETFGEMLGMIGFTGA